MADIIKGIAYAKVNLFLDVTGKLNDGYHSVSTVMQSISLGDGIRIEIAPAEKTELRILCDNPEIPTSDKNLAWRAAELFLGAVGKTADIRVQIDKRIPASAGLAGGSSDAACVLNLLNGYYGNLLSYRRLSQLAAEIGSDVPFCLSGGTQAAEGKGEILTPMKKIPWCCFVVAIADENVSTAGAYAKLDKLYGNFESYAPNPGYEAMKEAVAQNDRQSILSNMYNIFENAVFSEYGGAAKIRSVLEEFSAEAVLLCGSGPAVFGIFPNSDEANNAVLKLRKSGVNAYSANPIYPGEEGRL